MRIERIVRKEEEIPVVREMWEIKYDKGWDNPEWETIAQGKTLEEAFAVAIEKGYHPDAEEKDLTTYRKYVNRTIDNINCNFVYDFYDKRFGYYAITHYYIFD